MSIWIKLKVNNNTIYLPFTKRITSLIINPVTGSIKNSVANSVINSVTIQQQNLRTNL